jgi:hypothetical protein
MCDKDVFSANFFMRSEIDKCVWNVIGKVLIGESRSNRQKAYPIATFSTTDPKNWPGFEAWPP